MFYILVLEFEFFFQQWNFDDEVQIPERVLSGWKPQLMNQKVVQKIVHFMHDIF